MTKKLLQTFAFISILAGVFIFTSNNSNANIPPLIADVAVNSSAVINFAALVDHNENNISIDRLSKHWTFVFFGFTHCPDVCPATLSQLVQINKHLQDQTQLENKPQFFFVSVDPQRDTPKHLASYMAYFDASFIGVVGDDKAIKNIEKQLGAFHRREKKDKKGFYSVQHSADIFLIDPAGRLAAKFSPPMDIKLVLKQYALFVKRYTQKTLLSET